MHGHSAVSWSQFFLGVFSKSIHSQSTIYGTKTAWFILMMKITLSLGLSLWLGSLINVLPTEKGTNHACVPLHNCTHTLSLISFLLYHYHHIIYGVKVRIVDVHIYCTRCHFKDSIRTLSEGEHWARMAYTYHYNKILRLLLRMHTENEWASEWNCEKKEKVKVWEKRKGRESDQKNHSNFQTSLLIHDTSLYNVSWDL